MEVQKKQNKIVKMVAFIFIIAAIALIWLAKNQEKKSADIIPAGDGEEFALLASKIDMEKLKSYGLPIMIDFGSDDCIPCKEMAPVLKEVNEEYQGKVIVKFADVWKDQSLADGFPLEVIPTQFFFTAEGKPFVPSNPEIMQMKMYTNQDTKEHIYTAHQGGMTKDQIISVFKEMGVDE